MKLSWLSGLFFALALIIYLILDEEEPQQNLTQAWQGYQPDYVATNLHNRNFDKNGDLISTVFAKTMESYPDLNLTLFYHPEVTLFSEQSQNQPTWQIQAAEGSLYHESEQLQLSGGVKISANNPDSQIQTIHAQALVLEIRSNQMHTDDQVTAIGPRIVMTGKGLHADLNQQSVEILQQVEAQYEHHSAN